MLGQCEAIIRTISEIPLPPKERQRLLLVSLRKGAQATTAIEGNTLTEEEIARIDEGESLPPSREYLEIEVKNIIEALNAIREDVIL
ncbi:MAG: Fic family protein, partial [Desulfomonilia bacterium]